MPRTFVHANEATAAQRRVYFDLRDAADGLTAETGEGGGQPQVSTNGGSWTNTGIGTLTHIGNGRYYADLTQSTVATAGDLVETRYKSANTAESPGDSVQVVGFDPADPVRLGLTALPNAAADAAGGLPISDAGGLDLDALFGRIAALLPRSGAVVSGMLGAGGFTVDVPETVNDHWNDALLIFTSGVNRGVGRLVMDYAPFVAGASQVLLYEAFPATPTLGDTFYLCPVGAGVGALIRSLGNVYWQNGSQLSYWLDALASSTAPRPIGMGGTGSSFDPATDSLQAIRDNQGTSDAPTVEEIDAQLSSTHGSGPWGATGASGARTITVTVENGSTGDPLPGAQVTVKNSADAVLVDQKRTNLSGVCAFSLDDATYRVHVSALPGFGALAGQTLVVTGNANVTYELDPLAAGTPAAGTRTVQVIVYGPSGQPVSGEVVTARLLEDPAAIDNALLAHTTTSATTDASGLAGLTLITSDQFEAGTGLYEIYSSNTGKYQVTVPAGSGAVNLQDLL